MIIAGVDEVGVGALCGPVVAASVILNDDYPIENLKDSKQITANKRISIANDLMQKVTYAIDFAVVDEIDHFNILQASLLAMKRSVESLPYIPDQVYVDGKNTIKGLQVPVKSFIKGDTYIPVISAASILAKVYRDNWMLSLSKIWPGYGLERNKGYPTKEHVYAIRKLGVTPIHRKSFKTVKEVILI